MGSIFFNCKGKIMKAVTVFVLLILSITGCSTEDPPTKPQENPLPQENIQITHLSHISARVGEKIVVHGKNFNKYTLHFAKLNDEYLKSNRTSDSTISLFIPHNAQSGRFTLVFNSPANDTTLTTPEISITDPCPADFCMDWNTKAAIEESDSWSKGLYNDTVKWNSETYSDTLFITRTGNCGDECSYTNTIAFKNNQSGQLPQFLYAVFTKRESMGGGPDINDTLKTGIVRIDAWDSSRRTGTFIYEDHNWVYWINN
jgi:hypothetical protein